ncbi:22687_t:CDS:2, partial [Racocetra persica]
VLTNMVNAQEYVENNFDKNVSQIGVISKNLEGDLDLSKYPNLTLVAVGNNPLLKIIRDTCRAGLKEKSELQELAQLILSNQPYDFFKLKQEIIKLKAQELPKMSKKLSEQKKEEIAEHFIQEITYTFGTTRNDQVKEAAKAYINKLDNFEGIETQSANLFDETIKNAFKTVTTNVYSKGQEYWVEFWGHYLCRRVYQEKLALKKENQDKITQLQTQIQQLQQQIQQLQM